MKNLIAFSLLLFLALMTYSCNSICGDDEMNNSQNPPQRDTCKLDFNYTFQKGCDGKEYPNPITSNYKLPFPKGTSFRTGLTNCSSSYHGPGRPDRYAFDFDMPEGTRYYACRGGEVVLVIKDQPSEGGGEKYGNWVIIDHGDDTFGIYLHSPKNGIYVRKGDIVKQGDLLGKIGRSGLAGYPHLHFIVVQNGYKWPYDPIPVSFRNVSPADVVLMSHTDYKVCED